MRFLRCFGIWIRKKNQSLIQNLNQSLIKSRIRVWIGFWFIAWFKFLIIEAQDKMWPKTDSESVLITFWILLWFSIEFTLALGTGKRSHASCSSKTALFWGKEYLCLYVRITRLQKDFSIQPQFMTQNFKSATVGLWNFLVVPFIKCSWEIREKTLEIHKKIFNTNGNGWVLCMIIDKYTIIDNIIRWSKKID